jgi:hypothetical protein
MIDERELAELLRAATDDIAVPVAPARELAAAGNKRRHRRWVVASLATAAAVAAVAVAVPVVLSSERSGRTVPSANSTSTAPGASCVDPVPSRVLPSWARSGFSDPRPRMPYVVGDDGAIAAILFAQPLTTPPSPDHSNKILWVARVDDGSSLRVTATLLDGSATATRVVDGGPGPSIIDLPKPGCWHLTLKWGDNVDTLNLAYLAP